MGSQRADEYLVDIWFRLKDQMIRDGLPEHANAIRPPSLRDAAYAYVLASRSANETSEEVIESFINGLELGAMQALRMAWNQHRTNQIANLPLKDRSDELQGPSEGL
jgi:hypothetical protein